MTRDETVALFLECEAKRAEARAAALAGGASEEGARTTGHEAAKAHWNAWAERMLAERKALEADGRWAAEKDWKGDLEPKNEDTRAWMDAATSTSPAVSLLLGGCGGQRDSGRKRRER